MSPATTPAGFASDAARRKRLGQYFTGVGLARLLAALAEGDGDSFGNAVDPMAGSGDMLVGFRELTAGSGPVAGIEIDPVAARLLQERIGEDGATAITGNAFSPEVIARLPRDAWDLVITNPPYVRYQLGAGSIGGELSLPSASEIRTGLLAVIAQHRSLAARDKELFTTLVQSYSGFADMAVPSWILAACLVRVGGRLAVVVPTTWLSRDYAYPIQYLLRRWFEVEVVVEDGDAAWFPDALVRTTLVVARRVERKASAFASGERESYPHIRLASRHAGAAGPVQGLFPNAVDPDRAFAAAVRARTHSLPETEWVDGRDSARALEAELGEAGWAQTLEADASPLRKARRGARSGLPPTTTLSGLGWNVGQGLRTGANAFFYGELVEATRGGVLLQVARAFGEQLVRVPASAAHPVLRRQAELDGKLSLSQDDLRGRVLLLHEFALPEDAAPGFCGYRRLPESLAAHVRAAATQAVGKNGNTRLIPELSAVAPNVRHGSSDGAPPRFWYHLPPLRPRHHAPLAVPRINHRHPVPLVNPARIVIDANFSTLWPDEDARVGDPYAIFALLTSSWVADTLEASATVLGGGALKVEAAHLRRLPLPALTGEDWRVMAELGRQLAAEPERHDEVVVDVDAVVERTAASSGRGKGRHRAAAAERLARRNPRR